MRTKLIRSKKQDISGYDGVLGTVEEYHYECPCGEGSILEMHDSTRGFREHDCFIRCATCSEDWIINKDAGVRGWELEEK